MKIRSATKEDISSIREIYNFYVVETPITFDLEPKSIEDRLEWFVQFGTTGPYRIFVAESEGGINGYACSTKLRPKAAYDTSVEVTIYVDPQSQKKGIGRALYTELFDALHHEEIHRAYALISLPNPASIVLHERFGFKPTGVMSEVGRKFGQYWDVAWYEKHLKQ